MSIERNVDIPHTLHKRINRALLAVTGAIAIGVAMGQGTFPGGPGGEPHCDEECWDILNTSTSAPCCWEGNDFECETYYKGCDAALFTRVEGSTYGAIKNMGFQTLSCMVCDGMLVPGNPPQCVDGGNCSATVMVSLPKPVGARACNPCSK